MSLRAHAGYLLGAFMATFLLLNFIFQSIRKQLLSVHQSAGEAYPAVITSD